MNHKRKRPKNRRAGCLLCKPHKANGAKNKQAASVKRALQIDTGEEELVWAACLKQGYVHFYLGGQWQVEPVKNPIARAASRALPKKRP